MTKRKTTAEFIEEAKAVHGDRYDYSRVEYKGAKDKVCIICNKGHESWQVPNKHLATQKCPICYPRKSDTESYVRESVKKWGNKYTYEKTEYTNNHTKIIVTCVKHGDYLTSPREHLKRGACPYCRDTGIMDEEMFIEESNRVHNFKYDYSIGDYTNIGGMVSIKCHSHGIFRQLAHDHIKGHGCRLCATNESKSGVYGIGINDVEEPIVLGSEIHKYYKIWQIMFCRCYDEKTHIKEPTYKDCTVDKRWHLFSNFVSFCKEKYVDGYHNDKDILVKNNKVYSPETCCFVPQEINGLFTKMQNHRGELPIGVTKCGNKYQAGVFIGKKRMYLGVFETPELAFYAYKEAKEKRIKDIANKWKDKIAPNVYEALIKYEVEITD